MKRGIVVRAPTGTAQIVAAERGPEKVIYWRLPMPSLFDEPNYKAAQYLAQTRGERTDRQGGLSLQSERYTAYPALLQTEYYRSSYGLRVLQSPVYHRPNVASVGPREVSTLLSKDVGDPTGAFSAGSGLIKIISGDYTYGRTNR